MTAHRRGFLRRAGVVTAVAIGALLFSALPARADDDLQFQDIGAVVLNVGGGSATLTITVTNKGDTAPGPGKTVTVTVPLSEQQVRVGNAPNCVQGGASNIVVCAVPANLGANKAQTYSIPLTPPQTSSLQPGGETSGNGGAVLSTGDNAQFRVTLKAPAQQQPPSQQASVTEVSGSVVNQLTGDPIGGATILVTDTASNEFNATANDKGAFKITPPAGKTITPGTLTIGAVKAGFDAGTQTKEGVAGRAVIGVRLSLKPTAATVPPSVPVDNGAAATPSESAAGIANPKASNASGDAGPNLLSWLAIGVGILLFLAGIGAIVVLIMRRKGDRDDGDDAYGQPDPRGPNGAPVPASHGVYHGGGRPDATRVGPPGGLNDVTTIVRPGHPQLDEFPDPYAAPASAQGYQSGGYAGATQVGGHGYDNSGGYPRNGAGAASGGYHGEPGYPDEPRGGRFPVDPQTSGGRNRFGPPDEARFGPADAPRYAEEPTGRFTPSAGGSGGYPSAGAYPNGGAPTNGYGGGYPEAGGQGGDNYGRQGGDSYGRHANGYEPGANGYGPAAGYGAGGPGAGGPGAGGPGAGGPGAAGPGAGGYGQPSGGPDYGHEPVNGYQDPRGQGGPPPNGRGHGRQVDWLDD